MRRAASFIGALLLCGCSTLTPAELETPPVTPAPTAALSVEVWRGFAQVPAVALPEAPQVELVLDVTDSMRAADSNQPLYFYGAREAAAQLVTSLPGAASVDVHVLGLKRGSPCGEATRVASGPVSQLRGSLARKLRRLQPVGESSCAATLTAIVRSRSNANEEMRVVAFTDLDESCGGDLCAAAEALVASGGELELVIFGAAEAPACLAALSSPPVAPADGAQPPKPPAFRLEAPESAEAPAAGRADGRPVTVPSGPAKLVLETSPPLELERLALEPGTRTRVWLLDFPTAEPPVREWHWKAEPASSPAPAGVR